MNEYVLVAFCFALLYVGILCFAFVREKQRRHKNQQTSVNSTLPLDRARHKAQNDKKQSAGCLLVEFVQTTVACRAEVKNTMPFENVNGSRRDGLDDIVVHHVIGSGHFKTVYRGTWRSYTVAISFMKKGGIHAEARLQRQIAFHPHLLTCYAYDLSTLRCC